MPSKQELIKQVAAEINWTQADVKRAIEDYGDVSTKEEVMACCLHYAGPELKKRNYQIGAMKTVNARQKSTIESLVQQLTSVQDFYQNELVPNLKATINAQSERIVELLQNVYSAIGGGK